MSTWSAAFTIVAYVASAVCLGVSLMRHTMPLRAVALALAGVAICLHAALAFGLHRGGVNLHFFAALSLVGLVIATLTVLVNLFRPVVGLGVIVFPLAALLLGVDVFVAQPTTALPFEWQIKLHVVFAVLAFGLLTIAALLAILLSLQERALRKRRLDSGLIRALPPLTLTESLMFHVIEAGFVLLTLTLVSGVLFVDNLFEQHLVHKTLLSITAWVVFGVLLFGRWRWGWRGRRAVNLTLAGMVVLVLAFFGSKFVLELVLKRVA